MWCCSCCLLTFTLLRFAPACTCVHVSSATAIAVLLLVLQDPALSTGIRHLIYNAVGLDYTYQSSLTLTIPLIRWLLSETDRMDAEAAKLCAYLVRLEQVNHQGMTASMYRI